MENKRRFRATKILSVIAFNLVCLFSVIYVITMGVEKRQAQGEEGSSRQAGQTRVITEFEGVKKTPPQPAGQPEPAKAAVAARGEAAKPSILAQAEPIVQVKPSYTAQPTRDFFLVDDFLGEEIKNRAGSRANVYVRPPSRIMISRRDDIINGAGKKALMIKYDKKNTGGPGGTGGWCGYYSIIKNEKTGEYFDGTSYKHITFMVKGEKGGENFMMGLADEHWDKIGDSLKSEEVGVYLAKGKITADWQKARIPLEAFFVDHAKLSSISINFEADCFPEGAGAGIVFIADIALEK
ncbi:MAG: hypothetical protein HY589_00345 [Candidatus Omnitrophica bacterium]|nr:hypothetical protein [Candidatus Omnitrophota bacterium]